MQPQLPPHPKVPLALDSNVEQRIHGALKQVELGRYKLAKAARVWRVPYYRLRSRSIGHNPKFENGGNHTKLSSVEEAVLWAWIHRVVAQGIHVRARQLAQATNEILRLSRETQSFKSATSRWAKRWLQRNRNDLHTRKAKPRSAARREADDPRILRYWFLKTLRAMRQSKISPQNLWNADETGFRVGVLNGYKVWTLEELDKPLLTDPADRILVTVMEAISAAGATIAPFIILPGKEIQMKHFKNDLHPDTAIATSENAYINDRLALDWIRHFEQLTRPVEADAWRMLVIDQHDSHKTQEFRDFCVNNRILINRLPPHSTHRLQPLDVTVFQVEKHWHQQDIVKNLERGSFVYGKDDFLAGLREIRERTFKPHTIRRAWAESGIVPFDPTIVIGQINSFDSSKRPEEFDDHWAHARVNEEAIKALRKAVEESDDEDDINDLPSPPRTPQGTPVPWNEVVTPAQNGLVGIERLSRFVDIRIKQAVASPLDPSFQPFSPSVEHVIRKRDKALATVALNGAKMEQELGRAVSEAKKKAARRSANKKLGKYGPVRACEAEWRLAKENIEVEEEIEAWQRQQQKKAIDAEDEAIRRWIREIKSVLKKSAKLWTPTIKDATCKRNGFVNKTGSVGIFNTRLQDQALLARHYTVQRQLRCKLLAEEITEAKASRAAELNATIGNGSKKRLAKDIRLEVDWVGSWLPALRLPWDFNEDIVDKAAMDFVLLSTARAKEQSDRAKQLSFSRFARASQQQGNQPRECSPKPPSNKESSDENSEFDF